MQCACSSFDFKSETFSLFNWYFGRYIAHVSFLCHGALLPRACSFDNHSKTRMNSYNVYRSLKIVIPTHWYEMSADNSFPISGLGKSLPNRYTILQKKPVSTILRLFRAKRAKRNRTGSLRKFGQKEPA